MTLGFLASAPSQTLQQKAMPIRLVALDIDGTLTDGGIVFGPEGELAKRFDVRDGFGLQLLKQAGIQRVIITGRGSRIVEKRVQDLGLDAVVQRCPDKAVALADLAQQFGLKLEQCAMMGDDWPDVPAMKVAGLAAAPADAQAEVKAVCDWISREKAGHGAVREFCEWLLKAQGHWPELLTRYGLQA
jgi:3-deoxy-D-manno-octulosonate 8-phosphate phosphatase (KDO 8-P phosphatase)